MVSLCGWCTVLAYGASVWLVYSVSLWCQCVVSVRWRCTVCDGTVLVCGDSVGCQCPVIVIVFGVSVWLGHSVIFPLSSDKCCGCFFLSSIYIHYLSIYIYVYPSVDLSAFLSLHFSVYWIHLSIYLYLCIFYLHSNLCLSTCF